MCSTGATCLRWVLSEMELDLADEAFEDCESVSWTFARNAMFLVERTFNENKTFKNKYNFDGRIPYCEACSNIVGYFWKIYEFLMNSFELFRLRDTEIAALVFGWGFNSMRVYSAYRMMSLRYAMFFSEYMLGEADYRRLTTISYTGQDFLNTQAEILWNVTKVGKETYMASLLRYGVMYLTPKSDGIQWREFFEALQFLFSWMKCRYLKNPQKFRNDFRPSRRMVNVLRVVQLLALKIDAGIDDSSSEDPRRQKFLVDTEGNSRHSGCDRFRCLKMLFDTIPEPFITSQEIREVFTMACDRPWSEESERHADELIAYFEQMYPDGESPPAPRSLQHLSRCQVRDSLRQSGALPHGFYHLVLPDTIRKYILLEELPSCVKSPVHSNSMIP